MHWNIRYFDSTKEDFHRGFGIPGGRNFMKTQNIPIQLTDPFPESTNIDQEISGNGSICWYAIRDGCLNAGRFNCFCNTYLCNDGGRHRASHFYLVAIFFMLKYIS